MTAEQQAEYEELGRLLAKRKGKPGYQSNRDDIEARMKALERSGDEETDS